MPLKLKNMKGIDFSCASQASTAICSSTDQHSMVKNTTKSFNRLNSYLNDHYKTFTNNIYNNNNNNHSSFSPRAPCISELPFTPRLSSSYREKPRKKPPPSVKHSDLTPRRKSSADITDFRRRCYEKCSYNYTTFSPPRGNSSRYLLGESKFLGSLHETREQNTTTQYDLMQVDYKACQKDSTIQYGLTEVEYKTRQQNVTKDSKHDAWALVPSTPIVTNTNEEAHEKKSFGSFLDEEKEKKLSKSLVVVNPSDQRVIKSTKYSGTEGTITKYSDHCPKQKSNLGYCNNNDSIVFKKSNHVTQSRDQVVVLRVSLHCRGCEGKLRKHLSKMEGVTSFSIDLETKKVTVIGNVTPLGVLTSISKVKNAQFWPSAASNSPSSSSSSSSSSTLGFN